MHRARGELLESGDEPQERRLPGPARAEHDDDLTLGDVERQALERNGRARPVAVDAERVPDGDGRRHSKLHEVRSGASARKAPRTVASTTTTESTTSSASAAATERAPQSSTSGGNGSVAPPVTWTTEATSRERRKPRIAPPTTPNASRQSARSRRCASQRRRGGALHLEVEERVPLVAEVAEHRRPQSDDGEQDRCESGRTEHGGNTPGEGVVVRPAGRASRAKCARAARTGAARAPARLRSRWLAGTRQPDLAGRARARSVHGQRRLQRVLVDDGELLVLAHRREAPGDRDDAAVDLVRQIVERDETARAGGGGDRRACENGQRVAVGRLARP